MDQTKTKRLCVYESEKKDKDFDCNECEAVAGTYISVSGRHCISSPYISDINGHHYSCIH